VTGAKAGETTRKSDNSEYEEKAFKKRVDGFVRSEEAIKMVFARKKIEKLTESEVKKMGHPPIWPIGE
jgi:hypothetical protein